MLTLSGAPSSTSHFDLYILSIFHYLGSPLGLCTLTSHKGWPLKKDSTVFTFISDSVYIMQPVNLTVYVGHYIILYVILFSRYNSVYNMNLT